MRSPITLLAAVAVLVAIALAARYCSRVAPSQTAVATPHNPAAQAVLRRPDPAPITAASPAAASTEHRMQVLDLALDAHGLRLTATTPASGRVKAPPLSVAPWRIAFTAFARDGAAVFAGTLDHPLHRRYEYEDPVQPGALRSTMVESTEGVLQLRLPAELSVARVAFFELSPGTVTPAAGRPLGEIVFP